MSMDLITFGLLPVLVLLTLGGPHLTASQTVLTALVPNCTTTIKNERGQSLCLWFVKDAKNWAEADEDCALHGGYLLSVTSPEIQDVVSAIMVNASVVSLWLGARETLSTWRWLLTHEETYHQGCHLDDPDKRDLEEVYEFPVNNSYALCSQKCESKGKRYAGVQSTTSCWCGNTFGSHGSPGKCNKLCPSDRSEVCGGTESNTIMVPKGTFSNWEEGQPNNHQQYQACAVMDDFKVWMWNDVKCTEFNGALCEIRADNSTCLSQGFFYDETWGCYTLTNITMSFYHARYYCHQHNGRLLHLDSANKTEFFIDVLKQTNYTLRAFYIGLTRTEWRWATGEPMYFSAWGPSRPNGRDQPCSTTDQLGKWNDVTCTGRHAYVCQKSNVTRLPTTTPEPTTEPPTTTTPPMFKFCNETVENCYTFLDDGSDPQRDIIIYALIGGGTVLGIILITMAICTFFIIQKHFKNQKDKRFDYFFGVDVSTQESSGQNKISPATSGGERTPTINGSVRSTEKLQKTISNENIDSEIKPPPSPNGILVKAEIVQTTPNGSVKAEVLPPSPSASIKYTEALTPSEESLLMKDTSQEVILMPNGLYEQNEKHGIDNNGFIISENESNALSNNKDEKDESNKNIDENAEDARVVIENNNNEKQKSVEFCPI